MSTTLQQAIETLESLRRHPTVRRRGKLAFELAGKLKGLLPKGTLSTPFIRRLRDSLYGKLYLP